MIARALILQTLAAIRSKHVTRKSNEPETRPVDPFTMASAAFAGFRTMNGFAAAMMEGWSDVGAEFMTFLAARIREDVKTQHRMLHAKDVEELSRIQADFVQNAVEQYAAETGKMIDLGQKITKRAIDGAPTDGGD